MTLLDDLRVEAVTVVEEGDWRKYARPGAFLGDAGVIVHHTAGSKDLQVIIKGRKGPNPLAGPLANIWLGKDGTAHLVSAGRCNHAGRGSGFVLQELRSGKAPMGDARVRGLADTTDGNTHFFGIEVENRGDGRDPYPLAQITGLVRCCAAFCRRAGWSATHVIGHKEWTHRKPDPTLDMPWLRRLVASQLAPTPDFEENDMRIVKEAGTDRLWAVGAGVARHLDGPTLTEYRKAWPEVAEPMTRAAILSHGEIGVHQ